MKPTNILGVNLVDRGEEKMSCIAFDRPCGKE